jgi:hypothetical protein
MWGGIPTDALKVIVATHNGFSVSFASLLIERVLTLFFFIS